MLRVTEITESNILQLNTLRQVEVGELLNHPLVIGEDSPVAPSFSTVARSHPQVLAKNHVSVQ